MNSLSTISHIETLPNVALPDHAAFDKICRQQLRKNWWTWGFLSVKHWTIFVSAAFFSSLLIKSPNGFTERDWDFVQLVTFMGFILPLFSAVRNAEQWKKESWNAIRAKRWECALTPEFYQFGEDRGEVEEIPWSEMTLESEDPGAWTIRYGSKLIVVFRKPLQETGLEDEFRRRAGF